MHVSRKAAALAATAVALVVVSSGSSAVATRLITGADIKDASVTGADIQRDSVPGNRIKPGSVRMEHLDRSSVRAGHTHLGSKPRVIEPKGSARSTSPRSSNNGVDLSAGINKNVVRLSNLSPGTYVVSAMGRLVNYATKVGTAYATYAGWCSIYADGEMIDTQNNQTPPSNSVTWTSPINMMKAFSLTETADVILSCGASVNPFSPAPTSPIATVYVDLVAFPVTSYSAG
jgi:hypothetical protein